MKKAILYLSILVLIMSVSGCTLFVPTQIDEELVGTWAGMGLILEFGEDGTGVYQTVTVGSWGTKDSKLYFTESLIAQPDGELPEFLTSNGFWGINYVIDGDDATFGEDSLFSEGFYLMKMRLYGSSLNNDGYRIESSSDHESGFLRKGTKLITWDVETPVEYGTRFVVTNMDTDNYYNFEVMGSTTFISGLDTFEFTADFDNDSSSPDTTMMFELE